MGQIQRCDINLHIFLYGVRHGQVEEIFRIEHDEVRASFARAVRAGHVHVPKRSCKDHFSVIEPQINAEGVHMWPFDASCPVDVLFLTEDGRHSLRMNRTGTSRFCISVRGRLTVIFRTGFFPSAKGDLAIVGSTLYHRVECQSSTPLTIAALFFEPDLIRCEGGSDSAEYLTPFLSGLRVSPYCAGGDRNPQPGIGADAAHPF